MASRPRRARVALGVIALASIGLGVWRGEALWWLATTVPKYAEFGGLTVYAPLSKEWVPEVMRRAGYRVPSRAPKDTRTRGWQTVRRLDPSVSHGLTVQYHVSTGFKALQAEYSHGERMRWTSWHADGRVERQIAAEESRRARGLNLNAFVRSPPWLWGVRDQTAPSMPAWMKDDAKWAKALEEAR